eukprot:scaffold10060_cov60-Phaeocystis_antarctica.AAC.1
MGSFSEQSMACDVTDCNVTDSVTTQNGVLIRGNIIVHQLCSYIAAPSHSISGVRMLSPPAPSPPPGATGGTGAAVDVDPLDPLEVDPG